MRHTTALNEVRHQLNACFIAALAFRKCSTEWVYQLGGVELAAKLEYLHSCLSLMSPSTSFRLVQAILRTVEVFRDDPVTINRAKWWARQGRAVAPQLPRWPGSDSDAFIANMASITLVTLASGSPTFFH